MSPDSLRASRDSVRRLAVAAQHLSGEVPSKATAETVLSVVRDLPYVQWDPVTVVAPSHILSLWNRIPGFRSADLDRLLWKEKKLFLHWTPIASIVPTEDYPLYNSLMSRYPESLSKSWGAQAARAKSYLVKHSDLRKRVLKELGRGPLQVNQFKDHATTKRSDGEWSFGSDVALMLFHLLMSGKVMVVGHQGNQNLWGLSEEFLPAWVNQDPLPEEEAARESVRRALAALGTGTPREIHYYFIRGRYKNLPATLARLEREGTIRRVTVEGFSPRDERYILSEDVPRLDPTPAHDKAPRLSLLPPFDNLIYSQPRTNLLFGFNYVREQFLPKEKRRFGTYVLPILWGDRLIGRIDPRLDSENGVLRINAVHAESGAPREREVADRLGETVGRLGAFLGACEVAYTAKVPPFWKSSLR